MASRVRALVGVAKPMSLLAAAKPGAEAEAGYIRPPCLRWFRAGQTDRKREFTRYQIRLATIYLLLLSPSQV